MCFPVFSFYDNQRIENGLKKLSRACLGLTNRISGGFVSPPGAGQKDFRSADNASF
jgi:hypothetical protein